MRRVVISSGVRSPPHWSAVCAVSCAGSQSPHRAGSDVASRAEFSAAERQDTHDNTHSTKPATTNTHAHNTHRNRETHTRTRNWTTARTALADASTLRHATVTAQPLLQPPMHTHNHTQEADGWNAIHVHTKPASINGALASDAAAGGIPPPPPLWQSASRQTPLPPPLPPMHPPATSLPASPVPPFCGPVGVLVADALTPATGLPMLAASWHTAAVATPVAPHAPSAATGAASPFLSMDPSAVISSHSSGPTRPAHSLPLLPPSAPPPVFGSLLSCVAAPSPIGPLPPMLSTEMAAALDAEEAFSPPTTLRESRVQLERRGSAGSRSSDTPPVASADPRPAIPSGHPPPSTSELASDDLRALDERSMYAGRRMACAGCHAVKSSCEGGRPCARCRRVGRPCIQREKARQKKRPNEAKSGPTKVAGRPDSAGAAEAGGAAAGAAASSSSWFADPSRSPAPASDSAHSSSISPPSRSLRDAPSSSPSTSPYLSSLGAPLRNTAREATDATGSPVHKQRKFSTADEQTTSSGAKHNTRRSNRVGPAQTQQSSSASAALHGTGPRSDFSSTLPPGWSSESLAVTASLSSQCLRNHLSIDSLSAVRSKVQCSEWSVRSAQRFVAELATQLTVADLTTLVARAEGHTDASRSLPNVMHRLQALVRLPTSPLFMLSWEASPMLATHSDNAEAELLIERLPDEPPSPNAERKRKRQIEQNQAADAAASSAAAIPPDDPATVSACAVPLVLTTNLALQQLLGYSQADLRHRFIQFGVQSPLLFLRADYVSPFHLLSLRCSLDRIHEYVCFAVFHRRDGTELYLCCHIKSDTGADGTVERTRTIYRIMPPGPMPPEGAHINLLQPFPRSF